MEKILNVETFKRKMKEFYQKHKEGKKKYVFTKDELLELIDRYDTYKKDLPKEDRRMMSRWLYGILGSLLYMKKGYSDEKLMMKVRMKLDIIKR